MPAKIRLQRKGKKGQPFYHIVIADGRAPREGRFIERIGTYNPLTSPAEIELNFDKAIDWMQKGAQPTDTVRAILSYKGVLYKYHLLQGVKKGAMNIEQAEEKFQTWASEKQAKIVTKIRENELKAKETKKEKSEYETKLKEAKAESVAQKLSKIAEAEASARKEAIAELQAKADAEAEAAAKMKAAARPTEETEDRPKAEKEPEAKGKTVTETEPMASAETNEGPVDEVKEDAAPESTASPQEPEPPAEDPKVE